MGKDKTYDGRRSNGRKPGTKITNTTKQKKLTRAGLTKVKKDRGKLMAINAIIDEFGSEADFLRMVAKEARKNHSDRKMLMEYAYDKPEQNHTGGLQKTDNRPVIQFINNGPITKDDIKTIDIDYEESKDSTESE
jgi:hypothetical protein